MTFSHRLVLWLNRHFRLVALTPIGGRHQRTVLAVGGELTMETSQVDSWLRNQSSEPSNEVQGMHKSAVPN
jgi:hypothetical protein